MNEPEQRYAPTERERRYAVALCTANTYAAARAVIALADAEIEAAHQSGIQRGRRHVPGSHIPMARPDYTTLTNERHAR